MKTNLATCAAIWVKKGQKEVFCAPIISKTATKLAKEKERKNRKSVEEERGRRD